MLSSIENAQSSMQKVLDSLKNVYEHFKTGRANPAVLDKVRVEAYGSLSPVSQVASVSVPEARLVVITPWDKSLLEAIEKAILKSDIGITPSNDGKVIRLAFAPLTEEKRKELCKEAKSVAEEHKVTIRNCRRTVMDEIKKLQKNGDISEDEQKEAEKKLQDLTDEYVNKISFEEQNKEKSIMEV